MSASDDHASENETWRRPTWSECRVGCGCGEGSASGNALIECLVKRLLCRELKFLELTERDDELLREERRLPPPPRPPRSPPRERERERDCSATRTLISRPFNSCPSNFLRAASISSRLAKHTSPRFRPYRNEQIIVCIINLN